MVRRARSGFTLIELLVVVAIIALLIAILMPALGKAKEITKRTTCAANLKGIGTSIGAYGTEWGVVLSSQRYAYATGWATNQAMYYRNDICKAWPGWSFSLQPYLGSLTARGLTCPALAARNPMENLVYQGSSWTFNNGGGGGKYPWVSGCFMFWAADPGNTRGSTTAYTLKDTSTPYSGFDNQAVKPGDLKPTELLAQDLYYSTGGNSYGNHPKGGSGTLLPEIKQGTGGWSYSAVFVANDPNNIGAGFSGANALMGDAHVEWYMPNRAQIVYGGNQGWWIFTNSRRQGN